MKLLASIHLLFYQRRTYFYMGVLGWWSHMLLSYCLFILSRLGAAQYLAFRLRCNWNASTLAVFIVGLQRFALFGSIHRFVFRWWKAATLLFPLCVWMRFMVRTDFIRDNDVIVFTLWLCCPSVSDVQWHFVWTFYIDYNDIDNLNWHSSEQFILWCAISFMNLLNNHNRIVNFILHFHKLTWSKFIPFKQGEVWRSRIFVYSRFINFVHILRVKVIILHGVALPYVSIALIASFHELYTLSVYASTFVYSYTFGFTFGFKFSI